MFFLSLSLPSSKFCVAFRLMCTPLVLVVLPPFDVVVVIIFAFPQMIYFLIPCGRLGSLTKIDEKNPTNVHFAVSAAFPVASPSVRVLPRWFCDSAAGVAQRLIAC
jgi:hypothetical protein